MVRGIRPEIEGRRIVEVEFCQCERKPILVSPSPDQFCQQLRNQEIRKVFRLAKRAALELSNSHYAVVEPRMTGLLLVAEPPTQEHRRICWHLRKARKKPDSFEFWDRRGLGTVSLLNEEQMTQLRSKMGCDALEITKDVLQQQLARTRREIKVALLDQKLVAGIGNLYASEILFRAKIHPETSACALTSPQIQRLAESTQFILNEAIRYEGSTLSDGTYRNALNQDGGYQNEHKVYQKADETCPECHKGKIRRIVQAQRSTFFCPICQRRKRG